MSSELSGGTSTESDQMDRKVPRFVTEHPIPAPEVVGHIVRGPLGPALPLPLQTQTTSSPPPPLAKMCFNAAQYHIREALKALGMECTPDNPSITKTPERFIKYLLEFMRPLNLDEIMGDESRFNSVHDNTSIHGIVVESHIPFRALCEHHLLPMIGYAHAGYIPNKKIIGISKIARLVEAYGTAWPSLQEAITEKVADALFDNLDSKGSIVTISAKHMCMCARGVNARETVTTTSCIRGVFRDVQAAREEFFELVRLSAR